MQHGRFILATLAALLLGSADTHAEEPPSGAVPFPVSRTTKLTARNGPVYFIDGPTVIPKKAEITVQLDVEIVGINGASLDVQGGLKIHGTQDHWVKIENVDFSPTRESAKGVHLDMVDLRGCKWVHGDDEGFAGMLTIENAAIQRDCAFDLTMRGGTLKLMTIESGIPWKIRCASPDPRTQPILVQVRSSWAHAIELTGACDATFRHSEIRGGIVCRSVTEVVVDGCDLTDTLAFHQGPDERFKDITLTKCNLFDGCTLVLDREANEEAKKEKVKVDKFYFGPRDGPGAVTQTAAVQALIQDAKDEPSRRVTARVGKPAKKKHRLVDYEQLRLRVPPVR